MLYQQRFRKWGLVVWLLVAAQLTAVYAQQMSSNIRFTTLAVGGDTLLLDSLSIVPGSVVMRLPDGAVLDTSMYELRHFDAALIWRQRPATDSVKAFYRVYPFALTAERYHKSYEAYREYSMGMLAKPFTYKPDKQPDMLIDFGNLDYNGSFSRSISFGSNQSVVLNSLFNLQLSGMVTRDLEVTAAITDNNIPIQPEGNTQQIQEFDRIFIQLRKDNHKVIVGDYDLFNPTADYFMRFSKKFQGGSYVGVHDFKKKGALTTGAAAGISRGKFSRNTLVVSEGNQGPYKLTGANGETFIIILANTEEVFVNGKKMERGADRDYVIDYNLGEITFMPRRIITKDLRVVVEFEYSERNYLRTSAFVNTEYIYNKSKIYFNLYSEQDSKGQNLQQDLSAARKTFLTQIGDSLQNAFYPGLDSVAFDAGRILYALRDTVIGAQSFDSVLVYSTNPADAKYAVTFTFVGEGKGDYRPASNTANGRVYQWVMPDTVSGYRLGSYAPLIFLITPKYQQLYTLGTEHRFSDNNVLQADVAMSNNDVNMFSKLNNDDNLGFAGRITYKADLPTKKDTAGKSIESVQVDAHYEFLQDRFVTVERYRNIEFNRDWNIQNDPLRFNEHLASATIGYRWQQLGSVSARFKSFVQPGNYRGFENGVKGNFIWKGLSVQFSNSYLRSLSNINNTHYVRPKVDVAYAFSKIKGWVLGTGLDHEVNQITLTGADTLSRPSFLWQNYNVYFATPDSARNKFRFEYINRLEHRPAGKQFDAPFFKAHTVNAIGNITTLKNQVLNYNLTYRHVSDADSANSSQPRNFYLGRIDYNVTILRGFIRSTTLYELGSGREQRTQVVYQVSPTNTGDFIWRDVNGDGIKQIDEFVVSPFREDSSYIRVFIVTPEFVAVNTNQFNQVININPAAIWKSKKDFRKVLSMFSLMASVQISKKTYASRSKKVGIYFNPIPLRRENEEIVSTVVSSRNSLYFNRLEAKYGGQIDVNYSRNRTLLTTGFENRELQSYGTTLRWNIIKPLFTQVGYTYGIKANQSDFFKNLRYQFSYHDAFMEVAYQHQTQIRVSAKYELSFKNNPNDSVGTQTGRVHRVSLDARYNRTAKTTITSNLSYATVLYNDRNFNNQQLEYAMLEGLRGGSNLVWSVGFEQILTNNIQLSIIYDGRMTGFTAGQKSTLQPVHTGRAEIRALF